MTLDLIGQGTQTILYKYMVQRGVGALRGGDDGCNAAIKNTHKREVVVSSFVMERKSIGLPLDGIC